MVSDNGEDEEQPHRRDEVQALHSHATPAEESEEGAAQQSSLVPRWKAKQLKQEHRCKRRKAAQETESRILKEWQLQIKTQSADAWKKLPISRACPQWLRKASPTHQLYERGGLFACARCGGVGAYKPQKLLQTCAGEGYKLAAYQVIREGRLPKGHKEWPSSWKGSGPPPLFRVNF